MPSQALSGLTSTLPDSRPERVDFRPERVDFRPDRADFRPEAPCRILMKSVTRANFGGSKIKIEILALIFFLMAR